MVKMAPNSKPVPLMVTVCDEGFVSGNAEFVGSYSR